MLPNTREIEERLRSYFDEEKQPSTAATIEIAAVYLFGSVARDEARASSDVDVGILYGTDPPRTLDALPVELEDELTRAVGHHVDVVVLNHAPVDLVHRVLRDGRLVYEGDRAARIRFEVRARNSYFDLLPVLERYRRSPRAGAR